MHAPPHRSAAVLAVGDELLLGQTADTNSPWIAARLRDLGILTLAFAAVPDDLQRHAAELARLARHADLVLCTGGLGPTADDLTRAALANALNQPLLEDPLAREAIESYFTSRGRSMPALNLAQALRPASALSLPNLQGTAPGLHARLHHADVFCLPGPPAEMKAMFERQVLPRLRPDPDRLVRTRVLHCVGIGESDLATRLGDLMDRSRNPLVGTTASAGVVSIRIRQEASPADPDAQQRLDLTEQAARHRADPFIFGADNDRLPAVVLSLLKAKGHTVGCVESCTAGLLSAQLTESPGASAAFMGSLVTYSNALKASLADVPQHLITAHGAVSAPVALAMAQGGLRRLHVNHALAITGIAGPDGARPPTDNADSKPVGSVFIARASSDGSAEVRRFQMLGDRPSIRAWSALAALAILRWKLAGLPPQPLLREVPLD